MLPRPTLSVVLPVLNEEPLLQDLHRELQIFLAKVALSTEVIFVDGGSTDGGVDTLKALVQSEPRFRLVTLTRNFGHQAALRAGLDYARGHAVIVMDSDLQDPFDVILEMVNLWKQGYDVVHARPRAPEGNTPLTRLTSSLSAKITRLAMPTEIPLETGDFRLTSRRVVVAVRELGEAHPFVRGLVAWVGFKQAEVMYNRSPRTAGRSKVSPAGRLAIAAKNLVSVSAVPLRFVSLLGMGIGAFCMLLAFWTLLMRLFSAPVPGWASTFLMLTFISSIQLILGGLIGEYLARIYEAVKARPAYLTGELVNIGDRDSNEVDNEPVLELANFNALGAVVPAPVAPTAPLATSLGLPAASAPVMSIPTASTDQSASAFVQSPPLYVPNPAADTPAMDIPAPAPMADLEASPQRSTVVGVPAMTGAAPLAAASPAPSMGAAKPVESAPSPAPAMINPPVARPPLVTHPPATPAVFEPPPPSTAALDSMDIIEVSKQGVATESKPPPPPRSARPSARMTPAPPVAATDRPLGRPRHATVMGVAPPVVPDVHKAQTKPPPPVEPAIVDVTVDAPVDATVETPIDTSKN